MHIFKILILLLFFLSLFSFNSYNEEIHNYSIIFMLTKYKLLNSLQHCQFSTLKILIKKLSLSCWGIIFFLLHCTSCKTIIEKLIHWKIQNIKSISLIRNVSFSFFCGGGGGGGFTLTMWSTHINFQTSLRIIHRIDFD